MNKLTGRRDQSVHNYAIHPIYTALANVMSAAMFFPLL